jgi:NADH:ubiquinone oxidoreductase subunit C
VIWSSPALPRNSLVEAAPTLRVLEEAFGSALTTQLAGDGVSVIVPRERLLDVCRLLRDTPALAFDLLVGETAVDWIDWFDVVYLLRSTTLGHDFSFTVQVDHDDPVVPSAWPVWKAANWLEREAYDLMGVRFEGHPDLRRVLTWDEFEGHPLRKDFGLGADKETAYYQVPPGYKKVDEV